jgi:hypothetical protein
MTAPDVRTPGGNRANAEEHGTQDSPILPTDHVARKRLATLQALGAMRGIEVRDLGADVYLITRWSFARDVHGLDELEQVLRLQGVRP